MTEINNEQNNQKVEDTPNVEKTYIVNDNAPNNQQYNYQQPYMQKPDTSATVSVLDWVLTIIVMSIPCVNVIMLFVYAFTGDKESKKNYFKARLILIAASIIASVIFWVVLIIVLGPKIPQFLEQLQQLRRSYGF
ncbi:MAG TPA: hypothetical protein PL054_05640 [Clostridia bacterium]|nr:hypothetical protein [Clostridia bacterium]